MTDEAKNIAWGLVMAVLISVALACIFSTCCRADCVVAFGATWCGPCQEMKPIEEALRKEGMDIRYVDIDINKPLAKAYGVRGVPCFVRVIERDGKTYEAGRIVGKCSAAQLRRLCVLPLATTIGSAARGAVREVLEW